MRQGVTVIPQAMVVVRVLKPGLSHVPGVENVLAIRTHDGRGEVQVAFSLVEGDVMVPVSVDQVREVPQ